MREHILIAGASGLVGSAVLQHYAALGQRVTALSRRPPRAHHDARHLALDLTDAAACRRQLGQLNDVTRVVYAALHEKPGLTAGWRDADQIATNRRMLQNLLDALEPAADLRHIALLQGTKAYGAHVRPIAVPAREGRDEARDVANFYWEQEDLLRERSHRGGWHWSIFRPQVIFGCSLGAAMNLIPAIGVYAALLKEQGEPLHYPGGPGSLMEAVDADLLARALSWSAETDAARDQVFNIANGDVFLWREVWPAIADALGMAPGEERPQRLGEAMPARAAEWDALRRRHGLHAPAMEAFVGQSFHYLDAIMGAGLHAPGPPVVVSSIKLRQAGFTEVMDTEAMFRKWFRYLREQRLLPAPSDTR